MKQNGFGRWITAGVLCVGLGGLIGWADRGMAQDNPFAPGWTLDGASSTLRFQSVKNVTKAETSTFASLTGGIDAEGNANIHVLLDSVDTTIDLRNVRMRFLFFETFKFPEAVITAKINPADIADIATARRKTVPLSYTLDLHGVQKTFDAEVSATLVQDDMVIVSSTVPIVVAASDFDLSEGVNKLQDAAKVVIIPQGTISFDFAFKRNAEGSTIAPPATEAEPAAPAAAALETSGDFSVEECAGRFEILSRSGNIYFGSGSARLKSESSALLDSVADIIARCPAMVIKVSGYTDSDGSDSANQALSEARAQSVAAYFVSKGVAADRVVAVGLGEANPAFPNDTSENKQRNRRIEFSLAGP